MKEPIICRLLDKYPDEPKPGDIFPIQGVEGYHIVLPNGAMFGTHDLSSDGRGRWTVTGIPTKLTVTPSIFSNKGRPNSWHGWLTDGFFKEC